MTRDLGKINAVRDMIGEIKHECQAYLLCKQLTGLTNQTMEDLVAFLQQLKKKLEDLEKQ